MGHTHARSTPACLPALLAALALTACIAPDDSPYPSPHGQALALAPVVLDAELTQLSRWNGGYCATVELHNATSRTISGWSVDVDLDGSTLDRERAWGAAFRVEGGLLRASAPAELAVLTPDQRRAFGFCATDRGHAQPDVSAAHGLDLEDVPEGLVPQLRLTSEWSSGYCAELTVTNSTAAQTWSWAVQVDLHGSTPTSLWSASASSDGSLMTFRPLAHNAVLAPGGSTRFGLCASAHAGQRPTLVTTGAEDRVHRLTVAVYLPRRIATCFIGEPCTDGQSCVGLRNDANELVEAFSDASFQAVRTTSPSRQGATKEQCLELVSSDAEHAAVLAELERFRANVQAWSLEAIELDLHVIILERLDMDQSRWGGGVWVAPWNLSEFALPRLDFTPDFNLVIPPIRDPELALHHDLGGCGGTFGADLGLAGAGFSWVPMTGRSFWFECAEQSVLTHEWLHQVHWAYHQLSSFTDLYDWTLPMCGQGDADPRRWFPDTHQCNEDPDFERCGLGECGGNDLVNTHVLGSHFDRRIDFKSNHCTDAVLNYGESAVDVGGGCL